MKTELIIINDYINQTQIELSFISLLEENGLIHIYEIENERFLHHDELPQLEKYARLYYDLSINIEGIDVIHHLMERIDILRNEIQGLRNQIRFFE